jgi:hypothetical protein
MMRKADLVVFRLHTCRITNLGVQYGCLFDYEILFFIHEDAFPVAPLCECGQGGGFIFPLLEGPGDQIRYFSTDYVLDSYGQLADPWAQRIWQHTFRRFGNHPKVDNPFKSPSETL